MTTAFASPIHSPVLRALAWRLVERAAFTGLESRDSGAPEDEWILERLSDGRHGLPWQLARDAFEEANERAPAPMADGLPMIAEATLRLEQGLPRVRDEEGWDAVCRILDPDLIALAHPGILFAGEQQSERGLRWSPVLRAHRTVFMRACDGELAEIHAHLGGSLPTCLLWSLLIHGHLPITAMQSMYPLGSNESRWVTFARQGRQSLITLLDWRTPAGRRGDAAADGGHSEAQWSDEWRFASRLLSGICFDHEEPADPARWPFTGATIDGSATLALLLPERRLLYHALKHALREVSLRSSTRDEMVDALFSLIRLRNAFNATFSQPPGHRGLTRFIDFYDRRSTLWTRPTRGALARRRNSGRGNALGFELLLETWLDDRSERGAVGGLGDNAGFHDAPLDIEWRTCLPLRGRAALDFFSDMARGIARLMKRRDCHQLRVGIIHHTIKTVARRDGGAALDEFQRLWFLLRHVPELRTLLVGVDAAANELACPPRSFSAAYHWLRRQLDDGAAIEAGPPIRLGFTFHAGEDFRDLLTGLRHVDEAAHLLAMEPGDRIGHALALSWPVDDFYITRGHAFPSIADHALDLVWAAALMHREDGQRELERDARDRLVALMTEVHADETGVKLPSLVAALDLDAPHPIDSPLRRALRPASAHEQDPEPAVRARREDELLDLLGIPRAVRDRLAPRPPRPRGWRRLVRACQQSVRRRVRERGLVIEVNPSSNRLIGGFDSIDRLPYTEISRPGPRESGQPPNIPIAIGTDDAGIFHTSLRREYDLVGQSAQAQGYPVPDILAWLEEIRHTSCRACFIPDHAPRGPELIRILEVLCRKELPNG